MRRREFLERAGVAGLAVGLAPGWALAAPSPGLRVDFLCGGRWVDASRLPAARAFARRDLWLEIEGFAPDSPQEPIALNLVHPHATVLAWSHREHPVPSTSAPARHRWSLEPSGAIEIAATQSARTERVRLGHGPSPGPRLHLGAYRLRSGRARILFRVQEA